MPQKVGFRKIDNDVFKALIAAKLPGAGYQIVLTVIDKTKGFQREKASISLTDFQKLTQLSRQSVRLAIKLLETKSIIHVERDGTRKTIYGLNDEAKWLTGKLNHPRLETKSPQTRKPVKTRTTDIKENIKKSIKDNKDDIYSDNSQGGCAPLRSSPPFPGKKDTLNPNPQGEATLGMPVQKALEIWRCDGAPWIHLGPGENCKDLEEFLSKNPNINHLRVIADWLYKKK